MLFSSITFLFDFLPAVLVLYFILPGRMRNAVLLATSLFFYFYGEPRYLLLMLFSSLVDYTAGLLIDRYRGSPGARWALVGSICCNLGILGFFKYADFFLENLNALTGASFSLLYIPLPIGVSFFTFQTMSYSIDVYRGEAPVQRNLLRFATYVSLFPQLVAGPIVRYQTVAEEMEHRRADADDIALGVRRFVLGLGKKVLIANLMGELNAALLGAAVPSVLGGWLSALAYTLQIYFDFSGYSDMAIGLGSLFGFHFLENFDHPLVSKSITEFWRRWHISLGVWFREYLYLPLGGNRVGRGKWVRNLLIVWFATGFWHGASWNYVLWGLLFGLLLALEKLALLRRLEQFPGWAQHLYTLFFVLLSFVLFQHEDLAVAAAQLRGMFGLAGLPLLSAEALYYLKSYAVLLAAACVGATALPQQLALWAAERRQDKEGAPLPEAIALAVLLLVCTAYLADASFNPFLYFRF